MAERAHIDAPAAGAHVERNTDYANAAGGQRLHAAEERKKVLLELRLDPSCANYSVPGSTPQAIVGSDGRLTEVRVVSKRTGVYLRYI